MVSNLKRGLSLFKKYFSKGGRKMIQDIYWQGILQSSSQKGGKSTKS